VTIPGLPDQLRCPLDCGWLEKQPAINGVGSDPRAHFVVGVIFGIELGIHIGRHFPTDAALAEKWTERALREQLPVPAEWWS